MTATAGCDWHTVTAETSTVIKNSNRESGMGSMPAFSRPRPRPVIVQIKAKARASDLQG